MSGSRKLEPRENDDFLHYQPQLDLNSGEIIGCGAVIRWHLARRRLALEHGCDIDIGTGLLFSAAYGGKALVKLLS